MQKEGSKLLWFYSSSDGVGRSGTFLCIHSQLERLKTEGEIDILKYLKSACTRHIGLLSDPVTGCKLSYNASYMYLKIYN